MISRSRGMRRMLRHRRRGHRCGSWEEDGEMYRRFYARCGLEKTIVTAWCLARPHSVALGGCCAYGTSCRHRCLAATCGGNVGKYSSVTHRRVAKRRLRFVQQTYLSSYAARLRQTTSADLATHATFNPSIVQNYEHEHEHPCHRMQSPHRR